MKKWLFCVSLAGMVAAYTPTAMAGDGLWRTSTHPEEFSTTDAESDPGMSMHHFEIRSSVQVSRKDLRDAFEASRDAYTKKLQKYAKCSQRDAEKAISAAHPGMKVEEVQLRNIRTSLVYVGIVTDDDSKYLVIVDAGNAKVLIDRELPTHHEKVFAPH